MKSFKEFVEAVTPSRFEPGETNYGNQSYQDRLAKKREEENAEEEKQQQGTSTKLYQDRKYGKGIRATEGGVKGWIKGGKFTPGNW